METKTVEVKQGQRWKRGAWLGEATVEAVFAGWCGGWKGHKDTEQTRAPHVHWSDGNWDRLTSLTDRRVNVPDAVAGCHLGCGCPVHRPAKPEPWRPAVDEFDLLPDAPGSVR